MKRGFRNFFLIASLVLPTACSSDNSETNKRSSTQETVASDDQISEKSGPAAEINAGKSATDSILDKDDPNILSLDVSDLHAVQLDPAPRVRLSWAGVANATAYRIAITDGKVPPIDCQGTVSSTTETSFEVLNLGANQFSSFRVCLEIGTYVSIGVVNTFFVGTPIPPEFSDLQLSLLEKTVTIDFTGEGGTTAGYRIAYRDDRTPSNCDDGTLIENAGTFEPEGLASIQIGPLLLRPTYFFRVCAKNKDLETRLSPGLTGQISMPLLRPTNFLGAMVTDEEMESANNPFLLALEWDGNADEYHFIMHDYTGGTTIDRTPPSCFESGFTKVNTSRHLMSATGGMLAALWICAFNDSFDPKTSKPTGLTLTVSSDGKTRYLSPIND